MCSLSFRFPRHFLHPKRAKHPAHRIDTPTLKNNVLCIKVTYNSQQAEVFRGPYAANIVEKHSELCEVHSVRYSADYHEGLTAEELVQSACTQGD
jgi:hypothetical protein